MFGFLKKKLKDAVSIFSKKAEREAVVVEEAKVPRKATDAKPKTIIEDRIKKTGEKPIKPEPAPQKPTLFNNILKYPAEEKATPKQEIQENEERSFLGKISDSFTKISLSEQKFEELFWDLELAMLENNIATEVIHKIKKDLMQELVNKKLSKSSLKEEIANSLNKSILELFGVDEIDLIKVAKSKKPYVIVFLGVNGAGKTTTIAKVIYMLKKHKISVVVAACDTFRAAAIDQLEDHTNKLGVKLIKHNYGSDPAAVAFDAIEHAKSKSKDVVLIDTAGRLHSNTNLMDELAKIIRVAKPDLKIFIGESITGNDCINQANEFNKAVGIDAIILAKADIDEKGGAAVSISYVTKKPILYLGTGQNYDDLEPFDKRKIIDNVGLSQS